MTNDTRPNEYLTKEELASMLRVSTRTIVNYVQSGAIPEPVRFGRRALWSKVALASFIQERVVELRV